MYQLEGDVVSFSAVRNFVRFYKHDHIEVDNPEDYLWMYINYVWQPIFNV